VLILVFVPLAFGAVRLWALGPILIAIGLAGVLWIVRILSTQEMSVVIALTAYAVTANPHDALGKRELAGERYQRAIQADPQNATYRAQLALHYQSWGDTDNAVASFARAYELDGDDPVPEIELQRLSKLGT
jgi:cytochrome c-type biogenesis protein CcmH/NrfG